MTLNEFSLLANEVQELLDQGGKAFADYQRSVGMSCPSGCGACCLNPDIHVTALETLPYVMKLYRDGLAEQTYQALKDHPTTVCYLYQSLNTDKGLGRCGDYQYRFTVCRSFGVSAFKNKQGELSMIACRKLKTEYPQQWNSLIAKDAPVMGTYASQINGLLPKYSKYMPVNQAILYMLEEVLHASYYEASL